MLPRNAAIPLQGGQTPKILLAKPPGGLRGDGTAVVKILRDEPAASKMSMSSLRLISESWEHCGDRLMQLMTDNADYTVVGVIGPPGVGKSSILNELYGFSPAAAGGGPGGGTTPAGAALPPFAVQADDARASARNTTSGIDARVSPSDRLILLDTQPVQCAALLADICRPDGSSSLAVLPGGEPVPADVALQVMGLQMGIFLCSVCHVVLVASEGLNDPAMWHFIRTVSMLKCGIPDPSLAAASAPAGAPRLASAASQRSREGGGVRANEGLLEDSGEEDDDDEEEDEEEEEEVREYFSDVVFVHTKLGEEECGGAYVANLHRSLSNFFPAPPFRADAAIQYRLPARFFPESSGRRALTSSAASSSTDGDMAGRAASAPDVESLGGGGEGVNFWVLPAKGGQNEVARWQQEGFSTMMHRFRNEVLSLGVKRQAFARPLSEKEWLRASARVWDAVKRSEVIADYCRLLCSSAAPHRRH